MKKSIVLFAISLFFFFGNVNALTIAPVDVTKMSIDELLDAMDKGYLTSENLVKIYLERIEAYDKLFNSINQINLNALERAKELDIERSNGTLRGKLHGIPILVKCNIDAYGIPTTAGTKSLSDNYPLANSFVVQKLVDEGAIILGSTNMSELAFSAANSYSSYGYVKNVFNVDYTPYGSSGGSAVAVRAAFGAASLGTDTNSSVRLPASGAGIVGLRPTLGAISRTGVIPYDIERDVVGVLSRDVSDNALLFSIIAGEDEKDIITIGNKISDINLDKTSLKGVNIGVALQYVKGSEKESGITGLTDGDIYRLVEDSIKKLEDQGANIIYLNDFVKDSNIRIAHTTYAGSTMCDYFNEYIKGTTGTIRSFEELADSKGHVQTLSGYVKSCGKSQKLKSTRDSKKAVYRDYVNNYFNEYKIDVLLYPTLKNKVFSFKETGNISPGSSLGSVIGYPSITVPMGFVGDFSYGIEFLSKAYGEDVLYNVALEYEKNNGNVIDTSMLTPTLYEIPIEVEELKILYESVLNSNSKENIRWANKVRKYFLEYNELSDIDNKAKILIDEYKTINKQFGSDINIGNKKCIIYFVNFIIIIAMFVIVKELLKCFK